jgi:fructosamine-3-kinase
MPQWQNLFTALREHDIDVSAGDLPRPVGGGEISSAWRVRAEGRAVFLKTGPASRLDMFQAEADGLRELEKADAVRVPEVLGCIFSGNESVLALEWIDFEPASESCEWMLGRNLARLHRYSAEQFGWRRNNTIGSTPQHNPWSDDWVEFFKAHRLGFQLQLAAENGFNGSLQAMGARLMGDLGRFFSGYWPEASLLHGDLWGGNWAACAGLPVVFDPAVYYGDRETDIAMTRLFGGFGTAFYEAYEEDWPLASGYAERERLYQLYHVLNHLNLFGTAYLGRAERLLRELT